MNKNSLKSHLIFFKTIFRLKNIAIFIIIFALIYTSAGIHLGILPDRLEKIVQDLTTVKKAKAAISVDTITTQQTCSSCNSFTISGHNISGTNPWVVVLVSLDDPDAAKQVSGITYNTTLNLILLERVNKGTDGGAKFGVEIWYLDPADNPADNNYDLVITLTDTNSASAGALTITDVDQTTPFDSGTTQKSTGKSTTQNLTIDSPTNDLVIDVISSETSSAMGQAGSEDERWDFETGGASATGHRAGGQTLPGAGASTTIGWTTSNDFASHLAVNVNVTGAPADLSWDTGTTDFEIWAGATSTTDAVNTWDNGTLACSASLSDSHGLLRTCGSINKNQKYRIQVILKNIGGGAASMASGDPVDHINVKTFWAGTNPTISAATDCVFEDVNSDNTSATCNVAFNGNDVRITNTGTTVLIAATTGTEGFAYLITTDDDVSLSDPSSYSSASIDAITENSSRVVIGVIRIKGIFIRGMIKIRGIVKFR